MEVSTLGTVPEADRHLTSELSEVHADGIEPGTETPGTGSPGTETGMGSVGPNTVPEPYPGLTSGEKNLQINALDNWPSQDNIQASVPNLPPLTPIPGATTMEEFFSLPLNMDGDSSPQSDQTLSLPVRALPIKDFQTLHRRFRRGVVG